MLLPDTATILAFGTILLIAVGGLQLWLWRRDPALPELGAWGVAHLLAGIGLGLLAARPVALHFVSIDVGNALILTGGGVGWMGARRFEGRSAALPVVLAGAALWLVACQLPAFYDSMPDRVAGSAALLALYGGLCVREFVRNRPGGRLPSRPALAILFAIDTIGHVSRLLVSLLSGFSQPVFSLPESMWFGWPAMVGTVIVTATSVLQIAAAKEAAEQRSNAVLAQARDAADRANLAKSRFLARMSHELRTPLNGMLGMAQMLTRDRYLHGMQHERAVMMERSGRHLLAIINDILDLASVESGQFQLAPRPALVADIVQGSVDLVAETAAAKRVTLEQACDPDVPQAVLADALRVRQIAVNLLGNAIKFTPGGGYVVLHVGRLAAEGGLRLTVTDTGPGVAPEFRPHLFQDFAQRPVGAGTGEGTGLGLSISASLAAAMGGAITYEPGLGGRGSRFVAALPLATAEPPVPLPVAVVPPRRAASGLLVLVVDDVLSNRRLAEAMLHQAGYSVWVAADGPAALAALRRDLLPDVVLMDVHMPGMDGLTAARRIRALRGRAGHVPILAVTADVSTDRAQDYLHAGMNGVVTKPIDIAALDDAIAAVVTPPMFSLEDAVSPRFAPATPPA
ncbi:MAG TPA: response regulator [Acetobacteraceae bacterium]|nr:response regulator [Acetobacteraceae bacterium]